MQIDVGPLSFDVVVQGHEDAPAVLLLHGFPQTSHSWRLLLPTGRRSDALGRRASYVQPRAQLSGHV